MPFVQEEEILAWKGKMRGSKRGSSEELELDLIEVFGEDESVLISSYPHTFVPSYSHIFIPSYSHIFIPTPRKIPIWRNCHR